MKRVMIVGSGGAGKSLLALELGCRLGLPVHHLDKLNWKPGWVATPAEEWRGIQEELVKNDSWIIDGNYGGTMDIRMAAADTVIFLDFSRWRCLWNWCMRIARYWGRTRPDMTPGCFEYIEWDMIKWIWRFHITSRPRILSLIDRYAGEKDIHVFRSRDEISFFLSKQIPKAG